MRKRRIVYIICLIGVILLNCFYIEYQFFFLFLMMLIMPALSLLMLIISVVTTRVDMKVSDMVITSDKKAKLVVTVADILGTVLANADAKVVIGYSEDDDISTEHMQFVTNLRKSKAVLSIVPKHYGEITVNLDDIKLYDYLGLFSLRKTFKGVQKIYVMPELEEISQERIGKLTHNDDEALVRGTYSGDGDEIVDLRAMTDGDDIRKVHWKMSANHPDEELVIKEYNQVVNKKSYIIVDMTSDESAPKQVQSEGDEKLAKKGKKSVKDGKKSAKESKESAKESKKSAKEGKKSAKESKKLTRASNQADMTDESAPKQVQSGEDTDRSEGTACSEFRDNLDKVYKMSLSLVDTYIKRDMEPVLVFWSGRPDDTTQSVIGDLEYKGMSESTGFTMVQVTSNADFQNAAVELMRATCSVDALGKTCATLKRRIDMNYANCCIVTARDIDSDTFPVIDVRQEELHN